jgi:hypothetical protein
VNTTARATAIHVVVCRSTSMNKLEGTPNVPLTTATKHERPCSIGRPAGWWPGKMKSLLRLRVSFAESRVSMRRARQWRCFFSSKRARMQFVHPRNPHSASREVQGLLGQCALATVAISGTLATSSVSYRPHYPGDETNPPSPLLFHRLQLNCD